MAYIDNSGVIGPPHSCHDLYAWVLRVDPGFNTDDAPIDRIVRDEEPDIELWQYMGRRFMPPNPPRQWTRTPRVAADYSPPRYGAVRGRIAIIRTQYSFATQALRDRVAARLTAEGFQVTDTWRSPVIT
jgi:hypothetical protein